MLAALPPVWLRVAGVVAAMAAVAGGLAPAASAQLEPQSPSSFDARLVAGEAIVGFEAGTSAGERLDARSAAGVDLERSLRLPQVQLVEVDGDVAAAVRRLERQPDVAYAQPNYRYRALAAPAPNDTFFGSLWGLADPAPPNPGVNALSGWETTRGAGQVIAIVDTGVDLTHPDLAGNLWSNPGEVVNGIDDDGNGRVDDLHGFDFVHDDGNPDDYELHGTHVAGTAAAIEANALGIAGVAPDAQVMAVRALDGDGSGSTADIADGIAYAAREGATVINLSLSGPAGMGDQAMSDAIGEANARDVVVVAAAGNSSSDNDLLPVSPCALGQPNLICVAAVTPGGTLASFSNFGATTVDLGAPGTGILSARADYATIATEGFEAGLGGWTPITIAGIPWAQSGVSSAGTVSAADSPGAGQAYAPTPTPSSSALAP